ncbi:hypothetical protein ACRAWF_39985 [Streptomyces sp. L7]
MTWTSSRPPSSRRSPSTTRPTSRSPRRPSRPSGTSCTTTRSHRAASGSTPTTRQPRRTGSPHCGTTTRASTTTFRRTRAPTGAWAGSTTPPTPSIRRTGTPSSTATPHADAAHPQDWPYEEKVLGWGAWPIDTGRSYADDGTANDSNTAGYSAA